MKNKKNILYIFIVLITALVTIIIGENLLDSLGQGRIANE